MKDLNNISAVPRILGITSPMTTGERMNGHATTSTKRDYLSLFESTILDQSKDYPDPEPILNLVRDDDVHPFLTKGSFSLWQGKQKSKKTTVLALAVASIIAENKSTDPIRFQSDEVGKVLFLDCEQGKSYAARTMKLILKVADLESSKNLIYCDLREIAPKERLELIKVALEFNHGIKLAVIDGLVDFMEDYMSSQEGHALVIELLKLCSQNNIHIAGVLHQNKADKNARAHIGSISSQKCEVEIMVERDPDDSSLSVVSFKETRGLPIDDFAIRWDKGQLPCIVQQWERVQQPSTGRKRLSQPHEFPEATHVEILTKVFKEQSELTSAEFQEGLMAAWSIFSDDMKLTRAKTFRSWYVQNGYLKENKNQSGNRTFNTLSEKYRVSQEPSRPTPSFLQSNIPFK